MSKTLKEIAEQLSKQQVTEKPQVTNKKTKQIPAKKIEESKPVPKVQLIYAFNGTGKTRLSRELKNLIAPKADDADEPLQKEYKYIYYNAFTEDLFYWDNDLEDDAEPKLKIQPNTFTDWILLKQGDVNIIDNFQRYTNKNLLPQFIEKEEIRKKDGKNVKIKTYPEVTFSFKRGDDTSSGNIKISKGEESNFVWSVFYTLLQEVTSTLNELGADKQFDQLEYVFIDDPVSSLDDNHLIELAVNLATLVKSSAFKDGKGVRFVITTHNPLFYNVLWNELNSDLYEEKPDGSRGKLIYQRKHSKKYRLEKKADGTFDLKESNDHPFAYHLFLLAEIKTAIESGQIEKYHFNFLRNILEKTTTFLGYKNWESLLEKIVTKNSDLIFAKRILNLYSHSAHAGEESAYIEEKEKDTLIGIVDRLTDTCGFAKEGTQNA